MASSVTVPLEGIARNRASVALLDVDVEAGESLAAELGATTQFLACDLTDVTALRDAVREAESRLGPIRALVNNAANDQRFPLEEITPEQWDASLAVNLRHQFFVTQAALPGMKGAGGGTVVNLSSIAWHVGIAELVSYAAAKAAVW